MEAINLLIEKANNIGRINTLNLLRYLKYCYILKEIDGLTASYITEELTKLRNRFKTDKDKLIKIREMELILLKYLINKYKKDV